MRVQLHLANPLRHHSFRKGCRQQDELRPYYQQLSWRKRVRLVPISRKRLFSMDAAPTLRLRSKRSLQKVSETEKEAVGQPYFWSGHWGLIDLI